MDLQEIRDNITSRRNKIFLLMEEVDFFDFIFVLSPINLWLPCSCSINKSAFKQLGTVKRPSDIPKSVTAIYDGYETLCYKLIHFFFKKKFSIIHKRFHSSSAKLHHLPKNDQSWYQHDFCPHAAIINEPKFPSPKSKIVVNLQKTLEEWKMMYSAG